MVAAVPLATVSQTNQKNLPSNDLRNIAIGLAAAITLILVAGQIYDSGSASVSALEDTADKRFITITSGQTANIEENSAATTAVMTVTTDSTPTGCAIASGDTDVDGDGNDPFSISTTCAITVNDAGDLNFESGTASFTLVINANDANGADSESVTVSVTNEAIDITATSASIAENTANGGAVVTLASTGDSATAAGFTISSGNTNGAFAVAAGGAVTVLDTSEIDYDTATSQTVVFTITDGTAAVTESVVITFTDVNDQTPSVTVAATYSQAEAASTAFQTYTIVDSDTSGTYTCTLGGNDAADFATSINGKVCTVTWAAAPNYESAQDTGGNNVYDITLAFSDGTNDLGAQTTAITVTDVNEAAPVFGDGATASANVAEVTGVGTYTATDADGTATQTYSIVAAGTDAGSVDHDLFSIVSNTGVLTFASAPNYEAPGCGASDDSNTCIVILQVTDGANTDTITITATVTDLNEAPPVFSDGATDTENTAEGSTTAGTYVATDADGTATQTYSIVTSGNNAASVDHDLFSVASGGVLTWAAAPNYEAPGCGAGNNALVCNVVISVTDGANTDTITVTVTVTNTVIDIAAAAPTIAESLANGGAVVTLTSSGDTATAAGFTISSGNANGAFAVAAGGAVTVADTSAIDYETATSQTVVFTITDGTAAVTESVVITFTDVNEAAPTFTAGATGACSSAEVTGCGTFAATDTDTTATQTYSISTAGGSTDHDLFSVASGGVLTFSSAPNYEAPGCGAGDDSNTCTVIISVTDGANTDTITITATVTDLNEAPPVFSDGATASATVNEETSAVGTYTATDADGTASQTYSIVTAGNNAASVDHDLFSIVANTGVLTFASAPDFETPGCGANNDGNSCVVVLSVTDGANTDTITVTATVADVAPAITGSQTGSVAENAASGADIMTVATTGDSATSWTINGGNSDGIFKISTAGLIEVDSTANLDAESDTSYTLTLVGADSTGNADVESVTISITDVNEATPVFSDGATDTASTAEGSTTVATFAATDADVTASLTYSIVAAGTDANSVDHDLFSVASGGVLTWAAAPNFEALGCGAGNNANSCVVILQVTDGANTDTITVTVTITNVVIDIAAAAPTIAENTANSGAVVTLTSSGDTATVAGFTISSGNANGAFAVAAGGAVTVADTSEIDYETATSQTVVFTITDGTAAVTESVVISFSDVNEAAPTFTAGATGACSSAEVTGCGTFAATDTDTTATQTYSIVASGTDANSVDSDLFSVASGGVLTFSSAPNYEAPGCGADDDSNTCTVIISVTDGANTDTITITATVTDLNEAPPVFSDGATVSVNVAETTTVGTYTATDADGAATQTYSIVTAGNNAASVDHDLFSIVANTGVLTFASAPNYEAPGCGAGNNALVCNVVLSVTDGANADSITVTVTVTDLNEAPPVFSDGATDTENTAEGSTAAGTYVATDADGTATQTYSIVTSGNNAASVDHDLFSVASGGVLTWAAAPNYEAPGCGAGNNALVCNVVISVTDGANTDTITVTVTVTNTVIDIAAASATIAENIANGGAVVTLTSSGDAATAAGFTISSGNDNGAFAVAAGGAVTVADTSAIDYDTTTSQTVVFTITDGTAAVTESVVITFTDVNDQTPTYNAGSTTISVAEGSSANIDSFAITDTDTSGTLACTESGNDADDFTCAISGSTLTITWTNTPDYDSATDSDTNNVYAYTITVGDGTNDASSTTYAVTVTDTNDQKPTATVAATYNHAEASATTFQTYTLTDSDTTGTYSCTLGGADALDFATSISSKTCTVTWAAAPNYESAQDTGGNNVYDITLAMSDGTNSNTYTTAVTVTDVNDQTPTYTAGSTTISVAEGSSANIDSFAITDTDTSGTLACTESGNDADDFTCAISGSTLTITWTNTPDYDSATDSDTNNVYAYTITVGDGTNDASSTTYAVTVTDTNDQAPSWTTSATASVAEGATAVATLAATDTDTADSGGLTYAITTEDPGSGTQFSLSGTTLTIAAQDYENPGCGAGSDSLTCVVVLSATDAANTATAHTITVTITDTNDQTPAVSVASTYSHAEAAATTFQTYTITDSDTSGSYTCTLGGNDAADFTASISGKVCTVVWAAAPNYESPADTGTNNVYDITIAFSDGTNDLAAQTTAVTVTDTNDQAPAWTTSATASVAEGATAVATLAATDTDTADSGGLTYAITTEDPGSGTQFSLSGTTLTIAAQDYENPGCGAGSDSLTCVVVLSATDAANTATAHTITVTITDTNDQAPVWTTSATANVAEGATAVATLAATDTDTADSGGLTYAITTDDPGSGTQFSLSGTSLTIAAQDYENPACGAGSDSLTCVVVLSATDAANTATAHTITVTITATNNNAPTFTGVDTTPSSAEMATGAFETFTIVDTDSTGTYGCTLGGADAADITCSISGTTVSLSYAATTDYESPADADTDNNYEFTVVIDDGANDGATQTFTASVTDVGLSIADASATINENVANSAAVVTAAVTEGTASSVTIISGNTDADSDGTGPFAISSGGAVTVADSGDIDYETTTSYTLVVAALDASDSDQATITITIADVNDQTPAVSVASTYSHAEAAATTFQTYTITDSDTSGTYTCTLGGDDAADFTASISGKVCTVVWAAAPNYESPADTGTNNVYDITIAFSDGTNDLAAQTTAVTVTDTNDQTPAVSVASTYSHAEAAATTFQTYTITDSDTSGTYTCTLGGDDAADFTASISGKVCTVVWAAAPNYESPADTGTNNVYDITIAFSDGTNDLTAQTTAVTVTDTNDQTPAVSVASTYSHAEAAATTFQTYTITDSDTSGTYTCTLGGDDAADFTASISGKVCTVVWAAAPNYESPADTGTNNVYDITIAFSDGTNDLAAQTTAVTVTDTNDQTPAVSVASTYSHAEAAATTFQTYTITDSDTSGTYTCTLGGDDAADFTASISGKVCTVVWAAAPNYESPADTDTDNVYDITIAFSDGTNDLAAQTTAVTVTDANDQTPSVSVSSTYTQAEAASTTWQTFTITDSDTSGTYTCTLGGDDAADFTASISGKVCTIVWAANPDYDSAADTDTDNVYDITIAFSDGTNDLAAQTTAVTVTDTNDQTPAVSVASTYSHAEAAATTFQTYTITDSDTSGTYTCTLGGDDAADFTASISGKVCTVVWAAAPNYESPADTGTNNVYDITIAFSDGTNDLAAQTTAVTVTDTNDQTPAVSVASTYSHAEAAATTFQTYTITDSDTSGTYTCTLGGDDAADFTASISGKVCTVVWAAAPNYESPADTDTDNVYDITIAFSDGTNDLAAQTTAVTVTDANDQTPAVSVASTYSHAEAAATTFQTYTITDSDTSGTYTCTLGGDDAADFTASISGKVCTVVWAAAPNYESPADTDTDNVYDITIAFSDGTNDLAAQTTAVTVTDTNDQTPAVSVASTYSHAEAAATTFQTYTITDSDTSGTYTCTLGGDDAADFTASISGKVCTVVWAAAPNYESPADTDTDNVYDITIAFSDGTNDLAAQTTAVTVTDANDQTPSVSVSSTYTQAEAASTTWQTFTITDSDTSGTYTCTLGGDDAADFSASISGKVCTIVWAANPDYDSAADTDTDNVYDITIAFSDGTNDLAAQTTAVTVTDANDQTPAVSVASTYSHAEAAATTFQTYTITDSDTSGTYTCTLGGDDAADFTASISGKVCTVVWAAAPNYESPADTDTDNVYDITIAFSDGTNDLAAQTTAVTVTDTNDQTPAVSVASTYSHAEAAATTFQTYTITDSDTSGTYTCTLGGDDAADFTASISGKVCTVVWAAAPNYESPADTDTDNVYDITIAFSDGTNDLAAQTTAVTVTDTNDQTPAVSVASTYSHAEAAATTFQTYTITDSDTSGTYTCTLGGDDAADFTASISGKVCTVVWAAAPNYESPADTDTDNVYDITIAFSDGTNDLAAQTTAVTVTDTNDQTPAVSVASTYSHAEAAATTFQTYTITDSDTSGTYTCTLGGDDAADFTASISGKVCTVVWAAAPNYESPADTDTDNVYDITIAFSDGTNDLAAQTTAVTVTDTNDQTPSVSVSSTYTQAEAASTTWQTFTITDSDTSGTYTCTLGGDDAADFSASISGKVCTIAWAANPDYDSAADTDTDNVYDITIAFSDGTNDLAAQTTAVTVTDANDQAPTYSGGDVTPSVAEGTTAVDSFTVVDTDTGDVNACSLGGADAASFACAVSGDSISIAFSTAPDYETPGSVAGTNVYAMTATISDGTNTGSALSYTVTVTDATEIIILDGQTGSVAEDASAGAAVMTVTITDSTPTAILFSAGNGDGIFAIATSGAVTIADATNLDFETTASYTLTIVAYDASSSDVADITISITNVNDAPTVTSAQADVSTAEDAVYSLDVSGNFDDEDTADTLSFTATGMPSTMSMSTAGVLSGTPVNADVGDHTVIVTATDDGTGTLTVTDTFVITVTNTNDAPTVASAIADVSAAEDAAYSLDASGTCTDVDASDTMSYTISGGPSTITATTAGVISGTPVNADVGAHTITVTCADAAGASATDSYVLTVTNTNDAPTVASAIADVSAAEDAAYSLDASGTCTDVDASDTMSYTISGGPSTITATTAGVISGTPVNADVGAHTITVTCADAAGASTTDAYVLTVTNTNDAPTVASAIADVSAAEDAAYSLDASGTCTDVDASDTMSYTISGGPSTITATTAGVISGTPVNADVGAHTITVTCADAAGASATDSYVLTVTNTNDAPTVASAIADVSAAEDAAYSLDASGTCADVDASDTMSYTISGGPSTITATTAGVISGTPVNADVGAHTITVTCADAAGASATDSYVLTVTNTNDAPTVASAIADVSAAEDAAYSLDASGTCTDVDASDTMSYTISGGPSTITATTAGVISGTPVNADVGAHTITVTCADAAGASTTDAYVLTVTNTNDAPTVTGANSAASTAEDAAYSLDASGTCTDVDASDTLSYTISGAPSTITATTAGVISGTPVNADVGAHTITVTCSDGTASATDSYVLTVTNTDDPTLGSNVATTFYTITGFDAYSDDDHLLKVTHSDGTVLCDITVDSSSGVSCPSFGLTSGTAIVEIYSDYYANEWDVTIVTPSGTSTTVDCFDFYSSSSSCRYTWITIATLTELSSMITTDITVTGDSYDDEVLTADTSLLSDDDGMGTFAYQWADADADVSGATSSTYTIPSCESAAVCSVLGKTYTVTVTHTDAYGTAQVMTASTATAAVTLNPDGDLDGDGIINSVDTDDDGDGWIDSSDAFPSDSDEWVDTDSDGIGNNEDTDDDGDGVADTDDDFPLDSTEQWDADGDGWGHNADSDDDGDGIEDTVDTDDDGDGDPDATDQFPNNPSEWDDTDSDGTGDNADTDDDGDGVDDVSDAFPLDSAETLDTDGDGTGNNADTDDDGDGFSDADEDTNCGEGTDPLDATSTPTDTDGDLSCNALDDDDDGDGVVDASDAFPLDSSETTDYDGDGTGDNADTDDDNDGYADDVDAFDNDVDAWTDTDGDGLADDFPNLQVTTTNSLCSITVYSSSSNDWTLNGYSYEDEYCTFTLPAGMSLDITVTTTSYGSEARAYLVTPSSASGSYVNLETSGGYSYFSSYSTYTYSYTEAGEYTLVVEDSYGDGGQSAVASYDSLATPSSSTAGTVLDLDDDGDGVSDTDEATAGTDPLDTDTDDDGDDDLNDQFPLDASEWDDTDSDGMGDNSDAFPADECATVDTDGDGMPDSIVSGCTTTLTEDTDDDGDGVLDAYDDFPLDSSETTDTDGDGTGDNADSDDDGDGTDDIDDWAPDDSSEWRDDDGDGIGNNDDADDDGDGTPDADDTYPLDYDNDGWDDLYEIACSTDRYSASSTPSDNDGDSVHPSDASGAVNLCDAVDDDDDNDAYLDVNDAFPMDTHAWADTDGDGAADTLDPSLTQVSTTTVQLCSNSAWYTMSSYPSPATGAYLAVSSSDDDSNGDGYEDAECTFTLPAGETLDLYLQTGSYGSEARVHVTDPSGTITSFSGYSSGSSNDLGTFTTAGTYTIYYGDTWGDGCNPSTYYGACFVQASYTYVTGSVAATVTPYGTLLDYDDDADGYTDLDETTNCDDGGAYASTADPLDASSTPGDMDSDLTCDALDSDRDGDSYGNAADVFPDDVNEWIDTDSDGTGNNADTDDDDDGTLDVDDAFSLDECADTDSDSDGKPDTLVAGCTSTLVRDDDDDGDGVWDVNDAFPNDDTESSDFDGDGVGDNADNDDDGDGVNDNPDVWQYNACASVDTDGDGMPDSQDAINSCGAVVGTISFEAPASASGMYTDTGDSSVNHTLSNNAGEPSVNYDSASYTACTTGGLTGYAFTCSFTLGEGETMSASIISGYTLAYHAMSLTGPSGHLLMAADDGDSYLDWASNGGNTWGPWTETGTYTWSQDADPFTGGASYSMVGFSATVTPGDLGYTASYISTGSNGLTDGDYFGVTNYASTVGAFTDGDQGYQMSDSDGIVQWMTGSVSDADHVSLDLFVASTGWENSDYITVSWVGTTTTVLLDTNGYDIDTDFPAYEGVWTTVAGEVDGTGYLLVEFASNSGSEVMYLDNVVVKSDGLDTDPDDDNDGHLDVNDDCPLDATEYLDSDGDGYCDIQDTDDDNDGTYDLNDEFPLDPTETSDADGDGIGDNADDDDDNDGCNDTVDQLPNDPADCFDHDGDGAGDNTDPDDDNDGVLDVDDAFPFDSTMSVDTDGDGIADYTAPAQFQGDFESGSIGGFWSTSGDALWFAQSTNVISGMYSAESGDVADNQNTWLSATVGNMINDTDTDGDGIDDMASISFAYDVSTEGNWDFLVFCVDTTSCTRTSGYVARWSGLTSGTYTHNVVAGTHDFHWVYFKDSIISGNADTVWLDDVTVSWPSYFTNLDTDDDNDGVLDDDDVDPLDPCLSLDTDGDGLADNLGATNLNGTACDPADYTIDEDDDDDTWSDDEEATCGSDPLVATSTPDDFEGDHICDVMDSDDDNDGVDDDTDAFPLDASEIGDNDGDGTGDNADADDDDDGVTDGLDEFPFDANEWVDTDGDGTGDNADTDDDDDGVEDANDAFPLDASEWDDTDGDMLGDNKDPDDDGDGVADVADPFPLDSSEWADDDGDGIGNNADDDDDGDGHADVNDAFPEDPSEWSDLDGDGQGDNSDADDDGDGVNDGIDDFPTDATEWIDSDEDGIGDNTDEDDDGDGVADVDDAFPLNPQETSDYDGDGVGDNSDTDDDGDSSPDVSDAFPYDITEWIDTDGDGIGNNADTDDDGDGHSDADEDQCGSNPENANSVPVDYDQDGICDAIDDSVDETVVEETETNTGFDNFRENVPGFTGIISTLALLGAAIGVGLAGRRKDD